MRDVVAGEVRAHLARRNIKQTELAEALRRDQTWLSRRLLGKVAFDVDDLATICEVLHVSMAELLGELPPASPRALDRRTPTDVVEPNQGWDTAAESLLLVA